MFLVNDRRKSVQDCLYDISKTLIYAHVVEENKQEVIRCI